MQVKYHLHRDDAFPQAHISLKEESVLQPSFFLKSSLEGHLLGSVG